MSTELPADYYLKNFTTLLDFVAATYDDVLSSQERGYYADFQRLSKSAQMLYVRLLCRSKSRFRLSKLSYPEIASLPAAAEELAEELAELGLAELNPRLPPAELLALFTVPEIVKLPLFYHQQKVPLIDRIHRQDFLQSYHFQAVFVLITEYLKLRSRIRSTALGG